jgi:hypothetical protein
MNTPTRVIPRVALCAALLFAAALQSRAQTAPATPRPADRKDDIVELSPFVVNLKDDNGWIASSSLSGQRTQEQLSNLPITVFGMTDQFMKDLNLFTLEDASRWVTGLDVTAYQDRRTDDQLTAYRGMTTGDRTTTQSARNFFTWLSPTDQYNIDRIDFNFGSNSLMYGDATPGGLPTTYTKIPQLSRNFGQVLLSFDNWDSRRYQVDINQTLGSKLALRINAVDRDTLSYINFYDNSLRAITGSLLYKPFAHTSVRVEVESGKNDRIRSTGEYAIKSVAAPGKGYANTGWYYTSDGTIVNNSATGTVAAVDKTNTSGTNLSFLAGQTDTVTLPGGATQNYAGFLKSFNALGNNQDYIIRPYHNISAWLDQSFGDLSLEASFNQQHEDQKRNDTDFGGTGSGAGAGAVINVDGAGRPYVDLASPNPKIYTGKSTTYRATAAYPLKFGDWMKQFLVATWGYEVDEFDTTRLNLANFAVEGGSTPVNITNNKIIYRAYLDTPAVYGTSFWDQFSFANLPRTATFQPGYYLSSDPNAPFVDIRPQRNWSVSASGRYFHDRLRTLFGIRDDASKRNRIVNQPTDAIGQTIFLGRPESTPPGTYAYDPEYNLDHKTYSAGILYTLFNTEHNLLNAYVNYSTSYHFQGFTKWNNQVLGPVTGDTREFGFKGETFKRTLSYSVAFYQTIKKNAAFAWSNPAGFTTTGTGAANGMQTLFNPIGLDPSDPSYFTVQQGLNSEDHTTSATEKSRGVEVSVQLQRTHGFQVLLNTSYNKLAAARDFSDFQARLAAALARQATYIAAGQPGYSPALITAAQQLISNNVGTVDVQGSRSKLYMANLLVDYQFAPSSVLKGTRVGVGGNWTGSYNIYVDSTHVIKGDAQLPISAYIIHERKIMKYPTVFRLGVTNLVDLENLNNRYRRIGITTLPTSTAGGIYQYTYVQPATITLSTTVNF